MSQLLVGSIIANLPGFVVLIIMLRLGRKESVPIKPLIFLVLLGTLLMIPIVALQTILGYGLKLPFFTAHPFISEIFMGIIVLAFSEELCKLMAAKIITWKGVYFTNTFQGMLFPAIVALTFGLVETITYVALVVTQHPDQFWFTVIARAFVGAPAHGAYGLIIGKFYGQAKLADSQHNVALKRKNLWFALLVPVLIHGVYDWLVGSQFIKIGDTSIVSYLVIFVDVLILVYAYFLFYREKKQKQSWSPINK